MKIRVTFSLAAFALFSSAGVLAQHQSKIIAALEDRTIRVTHELTFFNESRDTLKSIVLTDWNNAYSGKETPLARRFSDEFTISYYRANDKARGFTNLGSVKNADGQVLPWIRTAKNPDLVEISVAVLPGQKIKLLLNYDIEVPSARFTGYGYDDKGNIRLTDCFLMPARYEKGKFVRYSNENLDDSANGISDVEIVLHTAANLRVVSDLDVSENTDSQNFKSYHLTGFGRTGFRVYIESANRFRSFRNNLIEAQISIEGKHVNDIHKAIAVDQIVRFADENLGSFPYPKITASQADYEQNPFYGLNQLPTFLNVFRDDFVFELKVLKTYLNNYLHQTLRLDPRKDHWVYDGIQVYLMMKYIDEFHPQMKMTGNLAHLKILRGYNLINLPFNGQYSYFYMLMARKNLDQPEGVAKDSLLKFNEQIATKYRAGLNLKYLESYLENGAVEKSIREFVALNRKRQTTAADFQDILKANSDKNIDWYFERVIATRDVIDYKFHKVEKTGDSVKVTFKNRGDIAAPMPIYGVKDKQVVFRRWIEKIDTDSVYTFSRNGAEKLVINYENEVPEYNTRNNWRSLKSFRIANKPVKFVFFKDLEDPHYHQILFVPTLTYNLYDGLTPGLRFSNKTILDRVFSYDVNPMYSSVTQSLSGSSALVFNQYIRDSRLFHIKYYLTGTLFHYAPDATYLKITPSVQFRIREDDFRDNRKQIITLREVIVDREKTSYNVGGDTENYAVFNARYVNTRPEVAKYFSYTTDFQAAANFGKASVEIEFRKLFATKRQLGLRLFAGTFLYNKTTDDYFSFALDHPTDYLFDHNYYGRSEKTGLFSRQLILTEGGFKSKLAPGFANQWIATLNAGVNIWNWVEVYGDAGFLKNHHDHEKFVYDSGIRLNLVTDYFELYFPVYSSNGWEFQPNYGERIRFIVTLDPKILVNLFTRKWF